MVEHDREVIRHADRLLDFRPARGAGGHIVAQGTGRLPNAQRPEHTECAECRVHAPEL